MCIVVIKNFLMLVETCGIGILMGLEMFGRGDGIYKFV